MIGEFTNKSLLEVNTVLDRIDTNSDTWIKDPLKNSLTLNIKFEGGCFWSIIVWVVNMIKPRNISAIERLTK